MRENGTVVYNIIIKGYLDKRRLGWFGDVEIIQISDESVVLICNISDKAELHGVLSRIRDLNLELISVSVGP